MAKLTGKMIVVYNGIPSLIAYVEANAKTAVKASADKMVAEAKRLAPVDTGYMKSSISSRSVEAGKMAELTVEAPYAGYVEYGTVYMAAQPFLGPAVAKYSNEFFDRVGVAMFKGWR